MHTLILKAPILATSALAGFIVWFSALLDEKFNIPLFTAMGVAVVFGRSAWWLSQKLQQLSDGQKALQLSQDDMHKRLDGLLCMKRDCPVPKNGDIGKD